MVAAEEKCDIFAKGNAATGEMEPEAGLAQASGGREVAESRKMVIAIDGRVFFRGSFLGRGRVVSGGLLAVYQQR